MRNTFNSMAFTKVELGLVLLVFCVCLGYAMVLPVDQCPDESGRLLISTWLFEKGSLPTGSELETIMVPSNGRTWGFSYALRPYLPAIISAFFMKLTSLFTTSTWALLVASRMVSVLSVTATCIFCLQLGHRLFQRRISAIALAVFVCFTPQVVFLGAYHNNDVLSLAAVSAILCCLVRGYDDHWSVKTCICLAVAISFALLSYYSVYGWILMAALFCVTAIALDQTITDKKTLLLKRAALVVGICLILAGWFFVRNALLHGGDFFGMAAEEASREHLQAMGFELFAWNRPSEIPGDTPLDFFLNENCLWLKLTMQSIVGIFGYMDILMPENRYLIYFAILALAAPIYLIAAIHNHPSKRDTLIILTMLIATIITFALSFWASYARDYQPQGRYVITALIFIGYMLAYGLDSLKFGFPQHEGEHTRITTILNPATLFIALWIGLFVCTCIDTMSRMLI